MYQQLRMMLLAALPGNTLLFRDKGFILMLMNPLSIQQSCLHDTNGSGTEHSSCMKSAPYFSSRSKRPIHDGQKAHFEVLLYAQKFYKAEAYVSSSSVRTIALSMDFTRSCLHQVASILVILISYVE